MGGGPEGRKLIRDSQAALGEAIEGSGATPSGTGWGTSSAWNQFAATAEDSLKVGGVYRVAEGGTVELREPGEGEFLGREGKADGRVGQFCRQAGSGPDGDVGMVVDRVWQVIHPKPPGVPRYVGIGVAWQ